MNDLVPLFSAAGGLGGVAALLIAVLRWVTQDRKETQAANAVLLERLKAANEREAASQKLVDDTRLAKRESEDRLIAEKRVLEQENFILRQQLGATGGTT